jgi:hypothetical protein
MTREVFLPEEKRDPKSISSCEVRVPPEKSFEARHPLELKKNENTDDYKRCKIYGF